MGKVVFNIVETDYDVSKDEEKYQKFRKDYLENLSVGVCRLQEQYGLTSYRREKFINRIRCEDHVRRRSGWVVFSVSVIISCCLVLCLTDFYDH
jgi:hypothetical protein